MRQIFASITAVLVVSISAGNAYASGDNTGSGGSSSAADFTSDHSGSVIATCSLKVEDGALPNDQSFVSSLTSTTKGKISTVCNSALSNLAVSVDPTSSAPTQPNYSATFRLDGATGAYLGSNMGSFATTYTKSNLTNNYSSTASTLDVTARASVPTSQLLSAGTYTIKVKATVTP